MKLATENQIFSHNLWKIHKTRGFHCFMDYFLIKSWASGGSARPRTPYKCTLLNSSQIFAKNSINFLRKIFIKIMKNWPKIVIFHWCFNKHFWKFLRRPPPGTAQAATPNKPGPCQRMLPVVYILSGTRQKSNKYLVKNYEKSQFSIEILIKKSQNFLEIFSSFLVQTRKIL